MPVETTARIPLATLFGNPAHLSPTLSPDGERLYFLAPYDGVLNIWSAPAVRPDEATVVTRDRHRGIRTFGLCFDDRTLFYLADSDGSENHRLYLVDLVSGQERCATPFPAVQARILAHNRWHPTTILLGLNLDRPTYHDVYGLDVSTGELTRIATNPGYLSWVIDTELRVRGGTAMNPDGSMTVHLDVPGPDIGDGAGAPRPWLHVPYEDTVGTRVLGLSRDGRTVHLLSSIGANTSRLLAVDTTSGASTVLAEDPVHDVTRVDMDPLTRAPAAVLFARDRQEWFFLDDAHGRAVDHVRAELARQGVEGEVFVDHDERTGRRCTVTVVRDDGPVRYYLQDRERGSLRFLFSHLPELDGYRMARMEPFAFTARDDVTVHGYVTWPPGTAARDLPAVVNVHGGPWARNSFCFDEEAQLLANRGYACVQVNFRGSTGYGKHFRNLGAREWGAAMQTDLLDAVQHLVGRGVVDPARVAIMGCSYGGYAALAGAAFHPDVFACAIDLCGPSSLLTMLAAGAAYRAPLRAFMHTHVGDPETDADLLWERSPLSRVADIRIPVLVAHGANDVRVTRQEAEQMVDALRSRGVPCEYLLFPDEGHGLARPANRETYYAAVERFLDQHLGGS